MSEAPEHPAGAAALARRLRRLETLGSASIRALSGDAALQWRGQRLWRGDLALPAQGPHLAPDPATDGLASFRGAADGLALRQGHSQAALHRALRPAEPTERWLFELLEQLRCESLATLDGVRQNLRQRFEDWSRTAHRSGLLETDSGLLLYTIAQIARSRVCAEPVAADTEDLIEATRAALVPQLGTALAGLRRERPRQAAYAVHALSVARQVAALLAAATPKPDSPARPAPRARHSHFTLWFEAEGPGEGGAGADGRTATAPPEPPVYRVYTRAHDRERRGADGIRPALLQEFRSRLDQQLQRSGLNGARLARVLRAALAQPQQDDWRDAQEDGRIDARRLARLVAVPGDTRLFRQPQPRPQVQAAVALLVDCSGSMREHIDAVALLVDLLGRAFEEAGTSVEVLGFSTGAWNGGRALADWQRAGRPAQPGRLAERCHWVFKDADTAWRRARREVAALLKGDRFREGLDGEAVDWACGRLLARTAPRRLLYVFSDGSPADSATGLANGHDYLDQHLRQVLLQRQRQGEVQVTGVGIGLDLGSHYPASVALDLAQGLRPADLLAIAETVRRPPRRG